MTALSQATSTVRLPRSPVLLVPALIALLVLSAVVAVTIGSADLPLGTVVRAVFARDDVPLLTEHIVWQLRLPRIAGAALVGAGLALSGAVVQTLTRNALADPYLLGISGGASVGAVLVIVLGVGVTSLGGQLAVSLAAFAGAVLALVLVLALATGRSGALPPGRTVLAGVAVGQLAYAVTSFVVLSSGDSDAARRVLRWTVGSLAGTRWDAVAVAAAVVGVLGAVVLAGSRALDAFAFGDRAASSLGVPVEVTRWVLYGTVALLTGAMVALAGSIGFVGLVVPHAVRLVLGPLHRRLLPVAALVGAVFLLWADTLARTLLGDTEVPIGVLTAFVGVPLFLVLLRRERSRS
ncbi:FecCD family ABC transporter permease [Modestobacter lacusdianchii]